MLTSDIQKAFKSRKNLIAVTFDLQKAFDMTWRTPIIKTLQQYGLNGHFLHYIKNFLSKRTFKVTMNGLKSQQKNLTNGVPQGEVLSVSLFLVAINKIANEIPDTVKACLFADDLLIYSSGNDIYNIRNNL